ncbi:hypothetical protein E2C01_034274 [Portunus trituberculatus]|uniref:Uncharacterized protein n=1 Tax=Portunus trituberculatus TaxID=210409 RepID=A0A5B7F667_PORTR|nr:hypothetical protein [Portunus trituberculatus]
MMEDFEASPTHIGGGRLDLTLTMNGSDCVQNVNGIPELLSDHWTQEYDIHLTRTTHQPNIMRTMWLTRKADWMKFTHHLNSWYASYVPPASVQSFADDLTNAIQAAADAPMPRKGKTKFNPNKKHLWYYDDRVKFLHRVSRQLTNTYKFTKAIEDKRNMVEWATYAREQIKAVREEKWLQTMGRLKHDTSMTLVWRLVNRVRGTHTQPPRHPDPAGKAAELMREYHERASDDSLPENIKEAKDNLDPTREAGVAEAARLADDTDAPITREELLRAWKTSRDTAPGQDGITYSMLNAVCHALVRALIDYASPALINITSTDARGLETIQNEALRTALGAPKWTKVDNLRSEAQVPPLTHKINTVMVNFLIKTTIRGQPDHLLALLHNHREQRNRGRWFRRAVEALNRSGITKETLIAATISAQAHTAPPWEKPCITTITNPLRKNKNLCVLAELRQGGLHNISDAQRPHTATYFTDGSTDPVTGRAASGRASTAAATITTDSARTTARVSIQWFRQVAAGCPPPTRHSPSHLCEVMASRIRLGYPYPWQLGLMTSEEEPWCRLYSAPEGHKLEH